MSIGDEELDWLAFVGSPDPDFAQADLSGCAGSRELRGGQETYSDRR
jgi:hypothetical protein